MKRMIVGLLIVCLLSVNGYSYGPRGHQLVGAIADRRLAKNQAAAKKVRKLLDGLTLQRVSTLPDEIKSWQCGREPFGQNRINRELQAFVNANCSHPSHTEFHYTDVPVFGNENYADGEVGRAEFDIVKMIPFCIRVLKGEVPENNERAITKSIAVILLSCLRLYSRYKLSKRILDGVNLRSTVPVGPLRCFAMINSAMFF
jgi:hypothetical protein